MLARAGMFERVVGRVLVAGRACANVYLSFGRVWKKDVTVTIDTRAQRLFAAAGFDPLTLEGALVRVRGWIEIAGGPRIAVTHPEQIEVLFRP